MSPHTLFLHSFIPKHVIIAFLWFFNIFFPTQQFSIIILHFNPSTVPFVLPSNIGFYSLYISHLNFYHYLFLTSVTDFTFLLNFIYYLFLLPFTCSGIFLWMDFTYGYVYLIFRFICSPNIPFPFPYFHWLCVNHLFYNSKCFSLNTLNSTLSSCFFSLFHFSNFLLVQYSFLILSLLMFLIPRLLFLFTKMFSEHPSFMNLQFQ